MNEIDNMKLPIGKNAEMCCFFPKCKLMFGCKAENINCDFSPSRFKEAKL